MPTFSPKTEVLDFAGAPILRNDERIMTVGDAIIHALTIDLPGDELKSYADRIGMHKLAARVAAEDPVTTNGADMVLVLSRLSRYASTTVIGRVHEAMDNTPDLLGAEAEALAAQSALQAEAEAERAAKRAKARERKAARAAAPADA